MRRRQFVTSLVAGGIAVPAFGDDQGHSGHGRVEGRLANAVVSFGAWQSSPLPFDRLLPNSSPLGPNDRTRNVHQLMPFEARLKVNGFVSFIISGAHNVQIFAPGTTFEQLEQTTPLPVLPIGPGIVDISTNREYRGLDPIALGAVQDRIETVQLTRPGRHLVICGLLPHFRDRMHGFVRVVENDDEN